MTRQRSSNPVEPGGRRRGTGRILGSFPFAVAISVVLIGIGAVLASDGLWAGRAALGTWLFTGILHTGAAVRRRQHAR